MRSSRETPSSSSSCLTALLTVDWVANTTLAAWEKPPWRTTSTKARRVRSSITIRYQTRLYSINSFYEYYAQGVESSPKDDSMQIPVPPPRPHHADISLTPARFAPPAP